MVKACWQEGPITWMHTAHAQVWQQLTALTPPPLPYAADDIWARIFKRSWSPEIDSEESTLPSYVAWRFGTTNRVVVQARQESIPGFLKRSTTTGSVVLERYLLYASQYNGRNAPGKGWEGLCIRGEQEKFTESSAIYNVDDPLTSSSNNSSYNPFTESTFGHSPWNRLEQAEPEFINLTRSLKPQPGGISFLAP